MIPPAGPHPDSDRENGASPMTYTADNPTDRVKKSAGRTLLCLLALLAVWLGACQSSESGEAPTPTPLPTPVAVEKPTYTVERGTVVNTLEFTGRVSPVIEQEPDEEPAFQSKRISLYEKYAKKLLGEDKAYYEETEKGRAVRFKNPKEKIIFTDAVKGKIEFDSGEFDDLVLMKSDGTPTYNFACVVDDINMRITHTIRGDDHISNTPKQIMIYNAFGARPK